MEILYFLQTVVGEQYVLTKDFEKVVYSRNASIEPPVLPDYIVRPRIIEEIQKILKFVNSSQHKPPIHIRCSSTSYWGGGVPTKGSIVLDLSRMNKIIEINEDTRCVTVEPGITFGELHTALENKGYRIGERPESAYSACVGGHVASMGAGLGQYIFGNQGDQVTGLKVVLPDGTLLTTGSGALEKVPKFTKWMFGPDLSGLFIGSEGVLGVIVEVTLKLYPLPEAMTFATFAFENIESTTETVHQIQKKLFSIQYLSCFEGSSFIKTYPQLDWGTTAARGIVLTVVIEGRSKEDSEIQKEGIKKEALKHDAEDLGEKFARDVFWKNRYTWAVTRSLRKGLRSIILFRVPTKKLPLFWEETRIIGKQYGLKVGRSCQARSRHFIDYHPSIRYSEEIPETWKKVKACKNALYLRFIELGGLPCRLPGQLPVSITHKFKNYLDFLRKLKSCIDPNNIMSPGKIVGL
ncbi:MAG: FAD-binding oxidoreductase [Promethearchaeota archaeon]